MTSRPGHNRSTAGLPLSTREAAVMMLLAEGWTNKAIGGRLGITAKTVDVYVQRLKRKVIGDDMDSGKVQRVVLAVTYWRMVRG